jgi:hypothetical protein
MGIVDSSPGRKARPGSDADHSHRLVPMSRMGRSYTLPLGVCLAVAGQLYFIVKFMFSTQKVLQEQI